MSINLRKVVKKILLSLVTLNTCFSSLIAEAMSANILPVFLIYIFSALGSVLTWLLSSGAAATRCLGRSSECPRQG